MNVEVVRQQARIGMDGVSVLLRQSILRLVDWPCQRAAGPGLVNVEEVRQQAGIGMDGDAVLLGQIRGRSQRASDLGLVHVHAHGDVAR